jgi:hypothetical protein
VSVDTDQGRRKVKESREIKELRGKILGMEMQLSILSKDLERFKSELIYNQKVLSKIQENIEFLKTSSAAVSIVEFKKIKQHKHLVETKIEYYTNKIKPLEQVFNKKENVRKQEMERFEQIYRMQFKNNVLEFPSDRRKKG